MAVMLTWMSFFYFIANFKFLKRLCSQSVDCVGFVELKKECDQAAWARSLCLPEREKKRMRMNVVVKILSK